MSKMYIGHHKIWNTKVDGTSPEDCAHQLGCDKSELELQEMEKTDYILLQVPKEFRGPLSYMAYERGHSAGESEVEMILEGLVADLAPVIQAFEKRIRAEASVAIRTTGCH